MTCKKNGEEHLFALKRPDELPFREGPLLDSFHSGWIEPNGKLTDKGKKIITYNLRQFASGADQYFLEYGRKEVTAKFLIGERSYINPERIMIVAGEDYQSLHISLSDKKIEVVTLFGEKVSIAF